MIRPASILAIGIAIWALAYQTPDHAGGWGIVRGLMIAIGSITSGYATGKLFELIRAWRERRMPGRLCRRVGHAWVHIGGRNAGCALDRDCECSVPVHECARCGDCDYGENDEAHATMAECAARRADA